MNAYKEFERKPNPRERANPLSALLFTYMVPIFVRNYKKGLKEEDLYQVLKEDEATSLGDELESTWNNEVKKNRNLPLHRSLFKLYGLELCFYGIFNCLNEVSLVLLMPFATGGFVSYFENENITDNDLYMYASILVLTIIVDAVLNHSVAFALVHLSSKMLTSCSSMIYRKSVILTQSALGKTTTGHIIDLLSRDIGNFQYGFVLIHYIWILPIQISIGTYLLYDLIGVSAFSGMSLLVLFIPIEVYIGKKKSELHLKRALKTDERLGLLNEILNGIKVIKMYVWERSFGQLIAFARRSEMKVLHTAIIIEAISFSLQIIIPGFATFISIIVYIGLGNTINAKTMYSVMIIYDAIRPAISMFTDGISNAAEVHVAMVRIEAYLKNDDLSCDKKSDVANNGNDLNSQSDILKTSEEFPKISVSNVSCRWNSDLSETTLTDINIELQNSQLVAIVGPVGSGKSSLFNAFLQELSIETGNLEIIGTISYSSQEPWLFSASVKQNILFANNYDEQRYKKVIDICGLESDLALFPDGDKTLVGEKGKVISGGQKARIGLARCVYKQADIYLLDDPLSAVDSKVGIRLFQECITHFLKNKLCVLITHQLQYLKVADKIIIFDEGKIVAQGSYDELQSSDVHFAKILQQFQSEKENVEEDEVIFKPDSHLAKPEDDFLDIEVQKESIQSGNIGAKVYLEYIKYGGNYCTLFIVLIIFLASQGISNYEDYFISFWINLEQHYSEMEKNNSTSNDTMDRETVIIIYSSLIIISSVIALVEAIVFFTLFLRASIKIHDIIFARLSHGILNFFNDNPTGRILNRFSEDLGEIDDYIPGVLGDVIQVALQFCGTIILTTIVNPWLVLPALGLIFSFYLIRVVYLETSRNVKRIEAVTRSNIFSQMTATLQGLSTIRACSAQQILIEEFDQYQDVHTSAWYLFISSGYAFTFFLDIVCAVVVTVIIIIFIIFRRDYYAGDAGLVITQYLSLTGMLQWGMHQWCELENHMTSVERLFEYKTIPVETVRKPVSNLPINWPEYGNIEFKNVSMKYNSKDPYVLRNLNFSIRSNEKVGVVGRTGAGKSSIVAALFQLYDIEGSIIVDNIDTTTMPLQDLREKISIIPQDPVLFSGTVRKNLDPFELYGDDTLWKSLAQVELKDVIEEMPLGLQSNVTENGSNFSVGQRQLICLARAILRHNKILVMDEATANVDPQTDEFIQSTIKLQFQDCSVITIAHRLHTIMDSNRIIVVDSGRITEFDHPHILLQDKHGVFRAMVEATGEMVSKNLQSIAENSFLELKNT